MHPELQEAVDLHHAIVAEAGNALVGYATEKALANVVLLSEIPTTYDKDQNRQVNAGNLLLRGVPGVGKTFFGVILAAISNAKFASSGLENRLVPPPASRSTASPSPACAARASWHTRPARCACSAPSSPAHGSSRAGAPTRCSAWAAMSAFPGGLMASLLRQAAGAGQCRRGAAAVATRRCCRWPTACAFGFDGDFGRARRARRIVTGNPVRAEIEALPPPARALRRPQRPAAPAGGRRQPGRQGAERVRAGRRWRCSPQAQRPRVTHQTGEQHIDALRAAYATAGVEAEVLRLHRRHGARAYAEADLVVCRAGAITVSRAVRRPAWPACWCRSSSATDDAPERQRAVDGRAAARRSTCRSAS